MIINIAGHDVLIDNEDYERVRDIDWHLSDRRYFRKCKRKGKKVTVIWLHKFILDAKEADVVDHKNGNTFDNRKINLRLCTTNQNAQNRKRFSNNKSGYKGVSFDKGRWRAYININGKRIHLGHYGTREEAYDAYCEASAKYHGEFGRVV